MPTEFAVSAILQPAPSTAQTAALWHVRLLTLTNAGQPLSDEQLRGIAGASFFLYRQCSMRHRRGCLGWVEQVVLPAIRASRSA